MLHYSTLATALWVGVTARNIYKQVTRKAKRYEELDEPPPPPRPMLRDDTEALKVQQRSQSVIKPLHIGCIDFCMLANDSSNVVKGIVQHFEKYTYWLCC